MDLYKKLNKQNLISIGIILSFIIFCIVNSLHHTIPINPIPLAGPSVEALFYVRGSSGSSALENCTCIGDGLLFSNKETKYDEIQTTDNIATAPDYSNYLPLDITIAWDTISKIDGQFIVLGSLVPKDIDYGFRDYLQNDNYGWKINQILSSINPKTTYYFSTSGNNNNDGLSPEKPKKDPNSYIKNGNCRIMLKSGDVFTPVCGFNVGSNVFISTYGGNQRAAISLEHTSTEKAQLIDPSNNIYSVPLDKTTNDIGYLKIGGYKCWKHVLSNNLVKDYEFYVDKTNKVLYFKSSQNLSGRQMTYSSAWNGMAISGKNNIVIENIEIIGAASHGISITYSNNILIKDCYIHDVGGAVQDSAGAKFGNGIELWANGCSNICVYKNIISDVFDAAITAQIDKTQDKNTTDLYFINNLIQRSNYGFECFHSSTRYTMKNVYVEDNVFYDIKDITNGYRLTKSSTTFTGYLCLWDYANSNCTININHNYGFKTQVNAISFQWKSDVTPPLKYNDNLLVINDQNKAIKNSAQYTGDENQYEKCASNSAEYRMYEKQVQNLIRSYSTAKIVE